MRIYLIRADVESMKEFVYRELICRDSIKILHKAEMNDGMENIYVAVDLSMTKYFLVACDVYGINIRWSNEKQEVA